MRGFRGLSGVGTREITKERLLRHGSVAISARGKIFQLPEVWPPPGYVSDQYINNIPVPGISIELSSKLILCGLSKLKSVILYATKNQS